MPAQEHEDEFMCAGCEDATSDPRWSRRPRVAIYTITMNRLDYTRRMLDTLRRHTLVPFDHFIVDNGSEDGTAEFLEAHREKFAAVQLNRENVGVPLAVNQALDLIGNDYDYVIKVDNDCEFLETGWLRTLVHVSEQLGDGWVLSPYVEGLGEGLEGGYPREDTFDCAGLPVSRSGHVGGLCCFAPFAAYAGFRYRRAHMHGQQDVLFSLHARLDLGLQVGYVEHVRVRHMDTTQGQLSRYPEYFVDRPLQWRTVYGENRLVTSAMHPLSRLIYLRRMATAGLLGTNLWHYLLQRASSRLCRSRGKSRRQ